MLSSLLPTPAGVQAPEEHEGASVLGHGDLASLSHLQTEEGHEPLVHPGVWQLPGSPQRQGWVRGVSRSLGLPGAGTCGQQLLQVQGRLVQFQQLQPQGRKPLLPLSLCLFPRRAPG